MKMSTPGIQENLHHQIPGMQETQERVWKWALQVMEALCYHHLASAPAQGSSLPYSRPPVSSHLLPGTSACLVVFSHCSSSFMASPYHTMSSRSKSGLSLGWTSWDPQQRSAREGIEIWVHLPLVPPHWGLYSDLWELPFPSLPVWHRVICSHWVWVLC
jgi:hypothetical protein